MERMNNANDATNAQGWYYLNTTTSMVLSSRNMPTLYSCYELRRFAANGPSTMASTMKTEEQC